MKNSKFKVIALFFLLFISQNIFGQMDYADDPDNKLLFLEEKVNFLTILLAITFVINFFSLVYTIYLIRKKHYSKK